MSVDDEYGYPIPPVGLSPSDPAYAAAPGVVATLQKWSDLEQYAVADGIVGEAGALAPPGVTPVRYGPGLTVTIPALEANINGVRYVNPTPKTFAVATAAGADRYDQIVIRLVRTGTSQRVTSEYVAGVAGAGATRPLVQNATTYEIPVVPFLLAAGAGTPTTTGSYGLSPVNSYDKWRESRRPRGIRSGRSFPEWKDIRDGERFLLAAPAAGFELVRTVPLGDQSLALDFVYYGTTWRVAPGQRLWKMAFGDDARRDFSGTSSTTGAVRIGSRGSGSTDALITWRPPRTLHGFRIAVQGQWLAYGGAVGDLATMSVVDYPGGTNTVYDRFAVQQQVTQGNRATAADGTYGELYQPRWGFEWSVDEGQSAVSTDRVHTWSVDLACPTGTHAIVGGTITCYSA